MKLTTFSLALIGSFSLAIRLAIPCVPDGGTSTTSLDRPKLPEAESGAPEPSSWEGGQGSPTAEEHDDATSNEPMGNATPSADGSSASVDVSNSGGDLSGPNGDVVNGGWEGDCIEVQICWHYTTWVKVLQFVFTETGFRTRYVWIKVRREICNGGNDTEVCPC